MKRYMILFHALAFLAGYTAIDNYNKKNTSNAKGNDIYYSNKNLYAINH